MSGSGCMRACRVLREALPDRSLVLSMCIVQGVERLQRLDARRVLRISAMGPAKSLCHHRLMLLEQKFRLHQQLNADKEFLAQKSAPHRDFYNVRKVWITPHVATSHAH